MKEITTDDFHCAREDLNTRHASHTEQKPMMERRTAPTNPHQLMTVRQASRLLEISPHTLRAWIAARKVEVVRLGRAVRVPLADVERLIAEGRVPRRAVR